MKLFLRWLVRLLYGFTTSNEEVLTAPGPVLLLPNHVSWWDWVLIGVCLEDDWKFVTSSTTAETTWVHRRIMVNRRTFPIDIQSPYAVKHMAEYLLKGGRLVLFPEGRLSSTGSLMKLFDGTGFLIYKTHAKVITAYQRGAKRLPFSPNPNRKKWFPRISVHFSPVLTPPKLTGISVTEARHRLTDWLRDRMINQQFETEMALGPRTLSEAIVETARRVPNRAAVQDISMKKLTYRRLLTGAEVLAEQWGDRLGPEPRVGLLLPNVNAMPLVLLSLWAAGKTPAVLNYSTGPAILAACARVAGLRQIITSRRFVERARLDLSGLTRAGIELLFVEDIASRLGATRKLRALARQLWRPGLRGHRPDPEEVAAILFTSGSEGDPKGVELTHRNLIANVRQMSSSIDLVDSDRFFNSLPLFHSFGLTVGLFLPLVEGVFVFLYPSPLHYRVVPSALYNLNCTVFFGTNTFLAGYARKAHPYDFRSVRHLFAGAEKVQDATVELWAKKFGVRILEGYGATECSPCLSVNLAMNPRPGSAGQLLPGIEYKLEPVEGVAGTNGSGSAPEAVGRLLVRGPNVMRGYVNPEANARFQALAGWYDTGDIVRVDADGFIHIVGRLKRFAKVSGEMVSLSAIEDVLAAAFPNFGLKFAVAVLAKPDEAKGERLVCVTNEPKLTLEAVRDAIRSHGLSNLAVPRDLKVMHEVPRLGTGKINHRELARLID